MWCSSDISFPTEPPHDLDTQMRTKTRPRWKENTNTPHVLTLTLLVNLILLFCFSTCVTSPAGPTPARLSKTRWRKRRSPPRLRLDPRRPTPEPPRWTSTSSSSRALQVRVAHPNPHEAPRSWSELHSRVIVSCLWRFFFHVRTKKRGNVSYVGFLLSSVERWESLSEKIWPVCFCASFRCRISLIKTKVI